MGLPNLRSTDVYKRQPLMDADQVDPRSVPLPGDETDAFVAVGPRGRPVKKPRRNRSSSTSSSASAMEVVLADGESGPGPTVPGDAQAPPASGRIPPVFLSLIHI